MLFPAFVAHETVRYEPGDARFSYVAIPPELSRAVASRLDAFRAGRHCARASLRRAAPELDADIAIRADRAPAWPRGIVGAITHTRGYAAAAVARAEDARGIGLDVEPIVDDEAMQTIAQQVAMDGELDAIRAAGLSHAAALTLVFSANESLFKCLYPIVERFFDFSAAALVEARSGAFTIELRDDLGSFRRGARFGGRYAVADLVETAVTLPA